MKRAQRHETDLYKEFCTIYVEGKIVKHRTNFDQSGILMQLGAISSTEHQGYYRETLSSRIRQDRVCRQPRSCFGETVQITLFCGQ